MRIYLVILLLVPVLCFSQTDKVEKEINSVCASLRKGNEAQLDYNLFVPENYSFIITKGGTLKNDTVTSVRNFAYSIVARSGINSTSADEKISAVTILSEGLSDNDYKIASFCAGSLKDYKQELFSAQAKASVVKAIKLEKGDLGAVTKIVGYLSMKELENDLQGISARGIFDQNTRWAAQLALARLGNKAAIQALQTSIASAKVGDDMMYYLFPEVLYTCNKELYKPFIDILYSDEKLCSSANPNNEASIICGNRIMEGFAKYVKDYPFQCYRSGSLKTKDYKAALVTVREWFKTNANSYQINTSVF